ncbi:unnamed protein product [Hermetia illucens]|uniref:Uncharacterized protein n=1 Tax=Hermetia illucens TaxID=343691 RepID=A0A7R8Z350_HERIL|nr:unnamed protein product [Hermetia illucens]
MTPRTAKPRRVIGVGVLRAIQRRFRICDGLRQLDLVTRQRPGGRNPGFCASEEKEARSSFQATRQGNGGGITPRHHPRPTTTSERPEISDSRQPDRSDNPGTKDDDHSEAQHPGTSSSPPEAIEQQHRPISELNQTADINQPQHHLIQQQRFQSK